jgi:hypothetical protein
LEILNQICKTSTGMCFLCTSSEFGIFVQIQNSTWMSEWIIQFDCLSFNALLFEIYTVVWNIRKRNKAFDLITVHGKSLDHPVINSHISHLFPLTDDVGHLKKPVTLGSHVNYLISWIFNDMINAGYDLFWPIRLLLASKAV